MLCLMGNMKNIAAAAVMVAVLALAGCAGADVKAPNVPTHRESTAQAAPAPTPTPTSEVAAVTLTEAQRHWMNVQVNDGGPLEQQYRDTFCPMDDAGRAYYADLVARQNTSMTADHVLLFFREWCA